MTPTPGQVAYETVHCDCGCWFRDLEDEDRQRWEAAAQAAISVWITTPLPEPLAGTEDPP